MLRKLLKDMFKESGEDRSKKLIKINFMVIIVMFLFAAIMLPFLPKEIPMQWNYDGTVSYTLPKILGVWLFPLIALLLNSRLMMKKSINLLNTILIGLFGVIMIIVYLFIAIKY